MDTPILEANNFAAWYTPNRIIVQGSHFSISPGSVVGLLGGNGAGKTTFIRGLSGILKGWSAETFASLGTQYTPSDKNFKRVRSVVFAEDHSFPLWSFSDLLRYFHAVYHVSMDKEYIDSLIQGFSFEPHIDTRLDNLSSGNNKKARLITAFSLRTPLLILDEPVDFLDFTGTEFLYSAIISKAKQGGAVFMSSHIAESFVRCCDSLYVLQNGLLTGEYPVPSDALEVSKLLKESDND